MAVILKYQLYQFVKFVMMKLNKTDLSFPLSKAYVST